MAAGPGLPANGVQRGTLNRIAGDPLTPGWAAVDGADRLELDEADLPKIPVHPISAESAKKILELLDGTPVAQLEPIGDDAENPEYDAAKVRADLAADWQGGFAFPYTIGPGASMKMDILNLLTRRPIYNVIARIEGHSEQDRAIILGTLRDAWVFGAVAASSGTSILLSIAEAFGKMRTEGWIPRRTIILASWDAERYGQIGSTEWCEDNQVLLTNQAISYINLDAPVQGIKRFGVHASPTLIDFVYQTAKDINIRNGASLYDWWNSNKRDSETRDTLNPTKSTPEVKIPGAGSDTTTFANHLGIDVAEFSFEGDRDLPVKHTVYDTFDYFKGLADPDFDYPPPPPPPPTHPPSLPAPASPPHPCHSYIDSTRASPIRCLFMSR